MDLIDWVMQFRKMIDEKMKQSWKVTCEVDDEIRCSWVVEDDALKSCAIKSGVQL